MTEFDAAEIARDVGELYEPLAEENGLALTVEAGNAGAGARQSRADQPGARQSGRQRHQIRGAAAPGRTGDVAPQIAGRGQRRRATASCSRSPTTARAFRKPIAARAVERFVRLEQSRSQPGSGLGLSLAAAVAHLHGGELTLEDNHPGLQAVDLRCRGEDPIGELRMTVPDGATSHASASRRVRSARRAIGARTASHRCDARPSGGRRLALPGCAGAERTALHEAMRTAPVLETFCRASPRLRPSVGPRGRRAGAPVCVCVDADPDAASSPHCWPRPPRAVATTADVDAAMRLLRRMKAEAALLDRARRHRRRLAGRCRRRGR